LFQKGNVVGERACGHDAHWCCWFERDGPRMGGRWLTVAGEQAEARSPGYHRPSPN